MLDSISSIADSQHQWQHIQTIAADADIKVKMVQGKDASYWYSTCAAAHTSASDLPSDVERHPRRQWLPMVTFPAKNQHHQQQGTNRVSAVISKGEFW